MKRSVKRLIIFSFLLISSSFAFSACEELGAVLAVGQEMYEQTSDKRGTYIGQAKTYSEAQKLATKKGYKYFIWYTKTHDVYGYNEKD